jgi:hypothetical protein
MMVAVGKIPKVPFELAFVHAIPSGSWPATVGAVTPLGMGRVSMDHS